MITLEQESDSSPTRRVSTTSTSSAVRASSHQDYHSTLVSATKSLQGDLPYLKISSVSINQGASGLAFEIGKAQGALLADEIREVWKFYRERFKTYSDQQLEDKAKYYQGVIANFDPSYSDEIHGIAAGANMPAWKIFVLNSRTELINSLEQSYSTLPGECSAVYFPDVKVIGQTWDWAEPLSNLMVATEIQRPDGHKIFMVTEPGIIGKMGMNSSGVGVTLNILAGNAASDGVPIHILLRAVLDCDSLNEAVARISHAKLGTMSSLIIGDDKGNHATLEFHGDRIYRINHNCHTNHYLQAGTEDKPEGFSGINTICRLARLTGLSEKATEQSVDTMKRILADHENGHHAISAAIKHYPDYGMDIGTLITIVMDLKNRQAHVASIKSENRNYSVFELNRPIH